MTLAVSKNRMLCSQWDEYLCISFQMSSEWWLHIWNCNIWAVTGTDVGCTRDACGVHYSQGKWCQIRTYCNTVSLLQLYFFIGMRVLKCTYTFICNYLRKNKGEVKMCEYQSQHCTYVNHFAKHSNSPHNFLKRRSFCSVQYICKSIAALKRRLSFHHNYRFQISPLSL